MNKIKVILTNSTLKPYKLVAVALMFCFFTAKDAKAQRKVGNKQIVQFSGVVVGQDSTTGVPGVHIYVPKAGRGTTSNLYGYFSMPTLEGDSVIISAIGFEKILYVVPSNRGENITEFFELQTDTTYLEEVEIFPYPTEKDFKEAVLALRLPSDNISQDNLGAEVLARMAETLPIDGGEAYNNFVNQQFNTAHNRYLYNPNPISTFLNPFAWAELIKSIKRGDFKKKKK
ncbi:carboxypeptidase-like regulatory domain-containing protein [Fulvivirgaceae bacterium BMA12]|uniref:Carboxypeptidase-like regulatory domain-containing protein n=1 Tax=Agaribacillus aureus TaxID=3051825 RepID=A0ABT8LGS5_9BACT|nr:carboxypeptidase-like regulatory domain-containing protein [Fulvivirgaceae bacterium BMA12]